MLSLGLVACNNGGSGHDAGSTGADTGSSLSDASLAAIGTSVDSAADCNAATACFSARYREPYTRFAAP